MTTVQDVLGRKGHDVVSVSPQDTVLEAAKRMNAARIGAVVVCEPGDAVVGIFTERDILRRVVGECRSPDSTRVQEVMTNPVISCQPDAKLQECQNIMTHKRIRHLPVIENGRLVGMISSGDILAQEVQLQQTTISYLHDYLHGRV